MASYLVQSGSTLNFVSRAGVITAVSLPSGITLFGASQPCRATVFAMGQFPIVVVSNGGTHDFWIDQAGTARQLQLASPTAAPTLAAGAGTGLNGVYKVACTFKVKDDNGATLMESGMGTLSSGSAVLVNQTLALTKVPVSGNGAVNARGIYRTLAGGNVLYPWFDIDNNITLTEDRGVADAALSILPTTATLNGSAPDLKLCVSWKERLWGVARQNPDNLRWTEERLFYAWGATNEIIAPPISTDSYGITGLIPRRDELGFARKSRLYKVVGNSNDSFQRVPISETLGLASQESVVVRDNIAYWLSDLGIVEWSDEGIRLISEAQVDSWFGTDDYFNRAMFQYAQGRYNADTQSVEWLLAAAGSSSLDRWVSYSVKERKWMGPHLTSAFTPTCAGSTSDFKGTLTDSALLPLTVFGGSDGYLYKRDKTALTDYQTAVAFAVSLPPLAGMNPDIDKVFGRPTIHTRVESTGTLSVSAAAGDLGTAFATADSHDLTIEHEVLPRLGQGRLVQVNLSHSATTERPRIYGMQIPFTFVGRRNG